MKHQLRNATIAPHMRTRVYGDVIARLHAAIAGMQAKKLQGSHEGWHSMDALQANLDHMEESLQAVLDGEQLETTERPVLFAMRELALASSPGMLLDGYYAMPGKNLVIGVGPLTVNIRRDRSGMDLIVLDSPTEANSTKTRYPYPPVGCGAINPKRTPHEVR